MVAKRVAARGDFAPITAIGCVIRGATPHFDYVAGECAKGLAQVSLDADLPVAFGVLTCDTIQQASERAGTKAGNKGWEAATSAIEMVDLYEQLELSAEEISTEAAVEIAAENPHISAGAEAPESEEEA